MNKLKAILLKEAEQRSEELNNMQIGTDEYTAAMEDVTAVVDRTIKMEELEIEKKKIDRETLVKIVSIGATVATFLIATGVKIWAHADNKKFEGYCTPTTTAGRNAEKELLSMDGVRLY